MYLKEFREKLNLTQNELSSILDIAQTTIARYENDKVKPTSTVLLKYINKLNANPYYLFMGREPMFLDKQAEINMEYKIRIKEKELESLKNDFETNKKIMGCKYESKE